MRAVGWSLPGCQEICSDEQRRVFRSMLRLPFLRHGFLPHGAAKRITPGDLADLPHPSERRSVWNATVDGQISPVHREVGNLAVTRASSNSRTDTPAATA